MRTQRIFILSRHVLLARGVETLLHGQRGLRVVGSETDREAGMKRIQVLQPDVVLLASEIGESQSLAMASAIFECNPGGVVIGLCLGENLLHIYRDSQMKVAKVEDLLQAIRQARTGSARS
ncbi:MAG: hypothetical protein A2Y61_05705 [Chloroflexi bacterium RBG_13_60_13]|nr:MAG: hypothetical protein A2Y61_05705 [Chloroflexi bacterium RBG_13_60_13]